jgi:hypothetical protein
LILTNGYGGSGFGAQARNFVSQYQSGGVPISSFPAHGTVTVVADAWPGNSSATVNYDLSQSGGNTSIAWTSTLVEDGQILSFASSAGAADFTVTGMDQAYTFTADFNGYGFLSGGGFGGGEATLYDVTAKQYLFFDSNPPFGMIGDHSGVLLAGHEYVLQASIEIDAPQGIAGSLVSAFGEFNFTTSVPEPTSLALTGLGAVGIAISAIRRRRQMHS